MDQLLKILILLLLIIVILLLIGLSVLIFYLYKKHLITEKTHVDQFKTLNCTNHPQIPSAGLCAICNEAFCEDCLREHEKLQFCPEHYQLFINHKWKVLDSIVTTPDKPELAYHLYSFKDDSWKESKTPSYIITHYKIDVESDHIESHIKLFAREEEIQSLKAQIKKPHQ